MGTHLHIILGSDLLCVPQLMFQHASITKLFHDASTSKTIPKLSYFLHAPFLELRLCYEKKKLSKGSDWALHIHIAVSGHYMAKRFQLIFTCVDSEVSDQNA